MAKIVHLFKDEGEESKEKLIEYIDNLRTQAELGNIRSLLIAAEGQEEGREVIVTGYVNMNYETRARMLVHHNMDLVKSMIDENYID